MHKRGGISLSIARNIAMCRKSIGSGRGERDGERYSRISIPMPEPLHPTRQPAPGRFGGTGGALEFLAR